MLKLFLDNSPVVGVRVNPFGEKIFDVLHSHCRDKIIYSFEKGKIYGIIGDYNQGGETLSQIIAGRISTPEVTVFCDGKPVDAKFFQDKGGYIDSKKTFQQMIRCGKKFIVFHI